MPHTVLHTHTLDYLLLSPGQNIIDIIICHSGILGVKHLLSSMANHGEHLFVPNLLVAVDQPALLDNYLIKVQLHLSSLHYSLLHRVLCDEAKHTNCPSLANAVSSILSGIKCLK